MTVLDFAARLRARRAGSRMRLSLLLGVMVSMSVLAAPVAAHYIDFSGEANQSTYVATNGTACVPAGCANHSWSFVSAGGASGTVPCGKLMASYDHGAFEYSCSENFNRHCAIARAHDGGGLNCHDQDSNSSIHAGSTNAGRSTTITMHGTY